MLQPETIYSSDSFKRAKNKFLSRATAIVVIGPRQIGNQPNAHLTYMLQINTILLLRQRSWSPKLRRRHHLVVFYEQLQNE